MAETKQKYFWNDLDTAVKTGGLSSGLSPTWSLLPEVRLPRCNDAPVMALSARPESG